MNLNAEMTCSSVIYFFFGREGRKHVHRLPLRSGVTRRLWLLPAQKVSRLSIKCRPQTPRGPSSAGIVARVTLSPLRPRTQSHITAIMAGREHKHTRISTSSIPTTDPIHVESIGLYDQVPATNKIKHIIPTTHSVCY